jgi:hypothetical protein
MKTSTLGRTAGALAAAALLLGLAAPPAPQGVGVGEEVAYTFRTAPLNAMGVTSLADLRGKPVVVEFWGTR